MPKYPKAARADGACLMEYERMGGLSIWHILVIGILFVLLFGRGKISEVMGDVAKGIKNFRQGMADDPKPTAQIGAPAEKPVETARTDANKV